VLGASKMGGGTFFFRTPLGSFFIKISDLHKVVHTQGRTKDARDHFPHLTLLLPCTVRERERQRALNFFFLHRTDKCRIYTNRHHLKLVSHQTTVN
jgi:hypothetical protein